MEEKLGNNPRKRKRHGEGDGDSLSSEASSSESEDEDDVGELATEVLDSEISATLKAIRSKDPRVYDEKATFYTAFDNGNDEEPSKGKIAKPMYLRDYHRENLLKGKNTVGDDEGAVPLTYNEEQEALKRSVVGEINAVAANGVDDGVLDGEDSGAEDGFMVAKSKKNGIERKEQEALDVEQADKDPETFLSNFMSARAWIPSEESRFQPLESDDEDDDRRAEQFEQAYNFRFEDPTKANEKLTSHARDVSSKYSVRRDEVNPRQKRRDAEKERKDAEKQQHTEEKARLRKLRVEEMEEKLRKIKRAAGMRGQNLQGQDWSRFLDDGWDDAKWEEEMQKRFGDSYYADYDVASEEEPSEVHLERKKLKVKKPKWEDDIDIKDLVPDFEKGEEATFSLSEDEPDGSADDGGNTGTKNPKKTSKDHKRERQDKKKDARKERRLIEQLVDDQLEIDTALLGGPSKKAGFRYRDTSPVSYGLSARDILLAQDTQLNEFAGLKKLAAFRDPEKKRKDQKHLGKRARLRKWRKDTFGDEEGLGNANLVHFPQQDEIASGDAATGSNGVDIRGEGGKKKRRRRTRKDKSEVDMD